MAKIIIVDENDRVIGSKERSEITRDDIYRCTGLWITNSNDEILMQKRSIKKKNSPGKWAPAVAGTVEEGESRASNIQKEAEEELGIVGQKFTKGPKYRTTTPKNNYFSQIFFVTLDWPIGKFKPDYGEMEETRWISREELITWVKERPEDFTTSVPKLIRELYLSDK